ncbi:MAG: hypothetical protein IJ720_03145 [Clostridia bacterium]|nr:hypothetical protein [Clostridia bacterium]
MIETYSVTPWRRVLGGFLDYLIVLYTILGTHSVYNSTVAGGYHVVPITAILMGLYICIFPDMFRKQNFKRFLIFAILWTAYLGIYALVAPSEKLVHLVSKFIILFFLYIGWFWSHYERKTLTDLFIKYAQIISIIALISLFFWVTASFLHWFGSTGTLDILWGKERTIHSFYGLYFHWQHDFSIHGHQLYRNIGIFTEAPMYSLHLTTALMFDIMLNHQRKAFRYFRIAVLLLAIVTTFSITGYLFAMALVVIDIYMILIKNARSEEPEERKKAVFAIVTITVLGIILAFVGYLLIADKLASRSGGVRKEDYKNGYLGWIDNIFFGAGYGDSEARQRYASWRWHHRAVDGYTNSPMAILCEGGIWFFLCFVVPFVYDLIAAWTKREWRLLVCIGLFIFVFVTTTIQHTSLLIAFMALSFTSMLTGNYQRDKFTFGRPFGTI